MANNKDFKVKNGIQPTVYHEGLGTVVSDVEGYYLAGASYDSKSFTTTSQATAPTYLSFKPDGTKFFITDSGTESIHQYSLSTSWDISTASYDSKSLNTSSQTTNIQSATFNASGTKVYASSRDNDAIYEYDLSTAWDISTATYNSVSFDTSGQVVNVRGIIFNDDGTKLFLVNDNGGIFRYGLTTAYDLSTCSYDSNTFSTSSQTTTPRGIAFNDDGTSLFIVGNTEASVFKYNLSTAYDLSTASYSNVSFSLSSQGSNSFGVTFKDDGTKMYYVSTGDDTIYQYSTVLNTASLDLSTGSVFEITPTSDIEINLSNPATSGTVSQATLLLDGAVVNTDGYDLSVLSYDNKTKVVFDSVSNPHAVRLSSDGTKMYVLQQQSAGTDDRVEEYDLSTAWDISTANYSQELDVSSFTSKPDDMFFKPDGSAIFLLDSGDDKVTMRTLSTAWDVSTAGTPTQSYTTTLTSVTNGLFFKSDGTEMFFAGQATAGGVVDQYTLSTAWDVTTATFYDRFTVNTQTGDPQSLALSSDGTVLFVLGSNDDIYEYSLSTAWDLKTASYTSNNYSINAQNNSMYGIHFRDDGYKMYAVGWVEEAVYQYTSGTQTPATITYDTTLEWPSGTAPTSPAIGETDVITFTTSDGGTSYQAVQAIDGAK